MNFRQIRQRSLDINGCGNRYPKEHIRALGFVSLHLSDKAYSQSDCFTRRIFSSGTKSRIARAGCSSPAEVQRSLW